MFGAIAKKLKTLDTGTKAPALTAEERRAINLAGYVDDHFKSLPQVFSRDVHNGDIRAVEHYVGMIQSMVMSRLAARAEPDLFAVAADDKEPPNA